MMRLISFCSTWTIILAMLIAVSTRSALATVDGAPAPEPVPETDGFASSEFLFQMVAGGATFVAGVGSHDGVLTLENVNIETIAFSDRPERIAIMVPTDEYLTLFETVGGGPEDNSFYSDPPNAAFSCAVGPSEIARAVFVLHSPSKSLASGALSFEVDVLYLSHPEDSLTCEGPVRSVSLS